MHLIQCPTAFDLLQTGSNRLLQAGRSLSAIEFVGSFHELVILAIVNRVGIFYCRNKTSFPLGSFKLMNSTLATDTNAFPPQYST